ncbi:DNA cytosine methyltransferase [Nostoc sp. CHAB 5784]|uniref:DNA cytosine methyltransferase n=1 Tax=Nostoc mirabile TaxID=2907820 RepID=UPI001E4119C2|nr:DNA cytosine methyltransferase [Nostoc mirabile]MCC5668516.1 DNA cytosine methyltransferase [Nostoc mirabile CHAB5784]
MTQQIAPQNTQEVLDLCSGIGGFTLGHMISGGFKTVAFCEINEYCQQVLSLRFPHIPIIPDIHDITTESLYRVGVGEVDGIIAGLPCPPFSLAGKRLAFQDERNLFGEFKRILCEIRPKWAIVENVPGLLVAESGQFLRTVLWQFASLGFDVEWGVLSANHVGAIHKRERVWIIAYSQSPRRHTSWSQYTQERTNPASVGSANAGNSQKHRLTNSVEYGAFSQPASSRGDDGLSTRLDGCLLTHTELTPWLCAATVPSFSRLSRREIAALTQQELAEYHQLYTQYLALRRQHKQQLIALGNAIVPQCAALIFERLKRIFKQQQKNS